MQQNNLFTDDGSESDQGADLKRISVLAPLPVDGCYTYAVSADEHIVAGSFVRISVAARQLYGVVWDDPVDEKLAWKKIKLIDDVIPVQPLAAEHRQFIDRMARYTMNPRGSILKMTLSTPAGLQEPKTQTIYALRDDANAKGSTPKRQAVMDALQNQEKQRRKGAGLPLQALARLAGVSSATVKAMAMDMQIKMESVAETPPCCFPVLSASYADPAQGGKTQDIVLSDAQQEAATAMVEAVNAHDFKTMMLDGVTGSGKTEVYFEAVAAALNQGKQILILLPEIALSNAFLDRFLQRFGCAPALWHSALTPAQRRKTWRGVLEGRTRVVVGARSALFLPFSDLGFIVVDEEHDPAFKQEEGVLYHARDMAVMRAHIQSCPISLISATPSLETVQNIKDKRYDHLVLPARFGGASMPIMHVVNMKAEKMPRTEFISTTLRKAIAETTANGQQSLLFLNRRGYAPLTLCRSCGHRYECPQCTAWLVMHGVGRKGYGGSLQCHHCGFSSRLDAKCTSCNAEDTLVPCGPGVERIAEEVAQVFPDLRSMVLASDTTTDGDDFFTALEKIRTGAVDLVIGTQIMAKGHHFPNLTCVGVIDADLGLQGGDLRAGEHTWQLLHQVSGRAGRGEHQGHVYIQTYSPDSAFIEALIKDDRDQFLGMELHERRQADMPPYTRLAALILSCEDENALMQYARHMAQSIPVADDDVSFYGPAPAPMYMLRGRYRARFLVQAHKRVDLQTLLAQWLAATKAKKPSKLRVQVDIDPHSFF